MAHVSCLSTAVPIAMCVFLVSSRTTVFFWSRTDRGALCGGANGGPGQDVKLPPAHPSTPQLIKEPRCSQRQHEDTLHGCVVNKSAGLSRWLCIRSCGYGVGTPFWVPAHVIMERKMFSELITAEAIMISFDSRSRDVCRVLDPTRRATYW